jgi:hypothetical protein
MDRALHKYIAVSGIAHPAASALKVVRASFSPFENVCHGMHSITALMNSAAASALP